ncbi:MAG: hypothetical protein K0S53_1910 [Bacteroidetes bacterium]|jgi:hypothetical protein|nr:hypothetical protein [Bacteroidota bacterium]
MKTLALIIGNDDYYTGAKLDNAINDARGIHEIFARLGFDIIYKENCLANDISEILTEFEKRIVDYDASIFYFSGHGFEVAGENYLAATDCQIADANKHHCNQTCIRLSEFLNILKENSTKTNIVIIDACRKSFERSGTIAFSPIQSPRGTLLAFSTSPHEGASDMGFGGHSVYTGALLQYIGRERVSVEELFKKVRKTVYSISGGKQTSWEHTSLIGDYYFNTGQLVYSLTIPYDETVVKDSKYTTPSDNFSKLILELKSYNWDRQNPAISALVALPANQLDKNQQFIFGRNMLQCSGAVHRAQSFMQNLDANLEKYNVDGENHFLNGILFEMYFDGHSEFRKDKTKKHFLEQVMALRKSGKYNKSFEFIHELISTTQYPLIYYPKKEDEFIDIDVVANTAKSKDVFDNEVTFEVISKISYNGIDILNELRNTGISGGDQQNFVEILSGFFTAPKQLVHINCNIELKNISLVKNQQDEGETAF